MDPISTYQRMWQGTFPLNAIQISTKYKNQLIDQWLDACEEELKMHYAAHNAVAEYLRKD